MSYEINPNKVEGVVQRTRYALEGSEFNHGEIMVGLAEFLGRLIVNVGKTPIAGTQAAQVILNHLQQTIVAGYTAHGFDMSSFNGGPQ